MDTMVINSTKQRANNQYNKAIEDMKKMENLKKYKDSIKRELYLDQTSNVVCKNCRPSLKVTRPAFSENYLLGKTCRLAIFTLVE